MKKNKKILFSLLCVLLMTCTMFQSSFAADDLKAADLDSEAEAYLQKSDLSAEAVDVLATSGLSTEAIEFLQENEVSFSNKNAKMVNSLEDLCSSDPELNGLNESILSLKQDVEAYDFSKEQVQKYVEGLITTTPIVAYSKEDAMRAGVLSTTPPYSTRLGDPQGAGYEVKSKAGYYKSTAFASLPTFSNFYNYNGDRTKRTAGYMFFTVSGPSSGIDIGISYSKGNSSTDTPQFYLCYYDPANSSTNPNDPGGVAKFKEYYTQRALSQGQNVYVKVEKIESGSRKGYVNFSVVNATDFSIVYASLDYYIGSRFVPSTGVINRQITLCDGSGQFNNGTKMNNAVFWSSNIYSTSGYDLTNSTNTDSSRRGTFPDDKNRTSVVVNWYAPWNDESLNLSF